MGNSQLLLKEFDAAVASLNTATKLAPNNVLAWASYANACKYAGKSSDLSRAKEKVEHLIEQRKRAQYQLSASKLFKL